MNAAPDPGVFGWKRRMGVHEAYHQNTANRVLHWLCIPVELWAVVKLLSLVAIFEPVDAALVVIVVIAPIYLVTEPVLGGLMVAFLASCWWTAPLALTDSPGWGAAAALGLFAVTFGAQVAAGHHIFEAGRDDTQKNLAELRRTKNPVPILLVFYYHLVEIALHLGYRPALRRDIADFTRAEIASWAGPTRD